jgi:small subunit ribosomal protein S17
MREGKNNFFKKQMTKEKEIKIKKRKLHGVVVSNKMEKTVRVLVERQKSHPRYKKVVNHRKIYFAHTQKELQKGDEVTIQESRPFSKNVKWKVI